MTSGPRRAASARNATWVRSTAQAYFGQPLRRWQAGRDRLQRLGDHARRDLAGLMPAGPVGDRPQAHVRAVNEGVFVVAPLRAGMPRGPGPQARGGHDVGSHVLSPLTSAPNIAA